LSGSPPEIRFPQPGVRQQTRRRVCRRDAARFHHVPPVCEPQRKIRVLFDQQNGQPLATKRADHAGHVLHQRRRQAEGRLVQEQDAGFPDQRPRERQHLLLAAAQRGARRSPAVGQGRKDGEHRRDLLVQALAAGKQQAADPEVLLDGQLREDAAALRHVLNAEPRDCLGWQRVDRPAIEQDGAGRRAKETGDGP